ncbi:glutathione peroxidase [Arsenicibacter rosenii]|uniref:Glutathione peroxidase n=1 Tax=Arsenicibacter rosenii TaxID=1750698 RepID=A0A1S2VRY5_9BACT|nr:glutathione peroxidase [Arsenicibacter rosenii]OIN61075.1 glutathione peroxidase [Arsenicibacter rosenii]
MKKPILLTIATLAVIVTLSSFMSVTRIIKHIFSNKSAVYTAPANMDYAGTKSLYDFTMKSLDGKSVNLDKFKGKKVVLLNTASACGYTPQYADWEKFYKEHGDKVVVLGFPANNFGNQESGSNQEIASFCQKNYGVTFPMFEKIDVVGDNQHPLYQWLSKKDLNGWNDQAPKWNFCKYVVDEKGQVTHFFASAVKPTAPEFLKAVGL